jgi:hypothetical protein
MVIHLLPESLPAGGASRRACDRYPRRAPEFPPRPGRRPGVSVWPCTAWGLSCPGGCPPGGGLLPRLFTLASTPVRAHRGGLFSVTLSIGWNFRPGPPRVFPRHAALWCSDFPLPPKRERPSTQRKSSRFSSRSQAKNATPRRNWIFRRLTPARLSVTSIPCSFDSGCPSSSWQSSRRFADRTNRST